MSHDWVCAAGASYAGAAVIGAAAISASVGALPPRPRGARVRCRAAFTLRSRLDLRDEYIDRFSTDLCRSTKKTEMIPISATAGPAKMYMGIGADYRRSVHM